MGEAQRKYTASQYFEIMKDSEERTELHRGEIVMQAAPSTMHNMIVSGMFFTMFSFVRFNKGKCRIFHAPYDVVLSEDNVVEPDLMVVCDADKIDEKRCYGAPDFIAEVVSSNRSDDYDRKLEMYREAGVREYWIIDPAERKVSVWLKGCEKPSVYSFEDDVPVDIWNGNLKMSVQEMIDMHYNG